MRNEKFEYRDRERERRRGNFNSSIEETEEGNSLPEQLI
jgi:hypothetical protein